MTEITPRDLVGVAGVPAIIGLVELVKRVWPGLPARFYPPLALAFGVGVNLALLGYSGADPVAAVAVGVVAGLMASGLYSQARTLAPYPLPSPPRQRGGSGPVPPSTGGPQGGPRGAQEGPRG